VARAKIAQPARGVRSQQLDQLLDRSNTGSEVWADSAYFSAETEAALKSKGYKSRIHRRGVRNRPTRARAEHVFADQENAMGRKIVRTIGIVRARAKIGMMNLVYNMRRLIQLERMVAAPT
jgi:transposase, IS5 family